MKSGVWNGDRKGSGATLGEPGRSGVGRYRGLGTRSGRGTRMGSFNGSSSHSIGSGTNDGAGGISNCGIGTPGVNGPGRDQSTRSFQFGGMIGSSGVATRGVRGVRGGETTTSGRTGSGSGASSSSRGPIGCGNRTPTIGDAMRAIAWTRVGSSGGGARGGGGGGGGANFGAVLVTSGRTVGSGGANASVPPPAPPLPPVDPPPAPPDSSCANKLSRYGSCVGYCSQREPVTSTVGRSAIGHFFRRSAFIFRPHAFAAALPATIFARPFFARFVDRFAERFAPVARTVFFRFRFPPLAARRTVPVAADSSARTAGVCWFQPCCALNRCLPVMFFERCSTRPTRGARPCRQTGWNPHSESLSGPR